MALTQDYPNGQPALRLHEDGSGFLYYHTEVGSRSAPPVAVCVSKVAEGQYSSFFYDAPSGSTTDGASTRGGAPKAPLLCSLDECLIGFANDNSGTHECIVPGVECAGYQPWPGKISKCKRCERTRGEHAAGKKLVLTKAGGTYSDERGTILKRWLWDPLKQGAGSPPSKPIIFSLNKYMTFEYVNRSSVRVSFKSESLKRVFECGEKLRRTDSYLDKVTATCIGELRGKKVVDTGAPSLLQRQQEAMKESAAQRLLLNPDFRQISNSDLASVMEDLDKTCGSLKSLSANPYPTSGWKEAALSRTLSEAPKYNLAAAKVSVERSSTLLATAGTSALGMTAGAGGAFGSTWGSIKPGGTMGITGALGGTMGSTMGGGMGAGEGAVEGYGSTAGASRKGGRWLSDLATRKALTKVHSTLERHPAVKDASGRYVKEDHSESAPTVFRKLRTISGAKFEEFLTKGVNPDQLVLVVCLREDDPQCRRVTQVLEHVNGTLAEAFPHSPQYASDDPSSDDDVEETTPCPYWLLKFDMAEGPFMVDRYNVKSLPCFLGFFNSKLVYAGLMGGSSLIKLPACNKTPNYLLVEDNPSSQIQLEKVLRTERVPSALASGTFDPSSGRNINVVADAKAHISRLSESATRRRGAAGSGAGSRGTDTSGDIADAYAVVLANVSLPEAHLRDLSQTLRRSGAAARSSGTPAVPGSDARLCGKSLFCLTLPMGSALPDSKCCTICRTIATKKTKPRSGGGGRGRMARSSSRRRFDSSASLADSPSKDSVSSRRTREDVGPLACPRCNIVQNPDRSMTADGLASLAVVKPIKPATVAVLNRLWNALTTQADSIARAAAAGRGGGSLVGSSAASRALPSTTRAGAIDDDAQDGALLGLTHDVLLDRMAEFLDAGQRARYLPSDFRFGVEVSASETTLRGMPLTRPVL